MAGPVALRNRGVTWPWDSTPESLHEKAEMSPQAPVQAFYATAHLPAHQLYVGVTLIHSLLHSTKRILGHLAGKLFL